MKEFVMPSGLFTFITPMKKYILCLIILVTGNLFAQQDPQYTLSYTNQMFFNPAAIGARHCIGATLQGRFQWVGMKDAPISWDFGLDVPFLFGKTKQNSIGFGVLGYGDYIGFQNNGGLRFGLNYRRLKLGPGDLAFGVDVGIATRRFANAAWDSVLPTPNAAGETFDMGIGLNYTGDNFYVGISCMHLNAGEIPLLHFRFAQHMYVNGGGFIPVGKNKNWRLNPNAIVRTDFSTVNFDAGVNAICFIKENHGILFGANYRFVDAVGLNIAYAIQFKKTVSGRQGMFMMGYNLDITTSRLSSFGSTSHEIVLRFCFPAKDVAFQRVFF